MTWSSSQAVWSPIKNNKVPAKIVTCPRCNNTNEFVFKSGSHGSGHKFYGFKCPICPHYEDVDDNVAKALMKRSGM